MSDKQLSKADQIKPLLLASQRQITSLLQDEVKAKKFMAASLVVASNPALNRCSPESIVQALIGVAMSDLNIDSNIGHCYLVPYGDKVQLQIGYKGFIQLLFRAGWLVKAFPVYQCDRFNMAFDGWDNRVDFVPNIDDRDEGDKAWVYQNLRGVFVVARHAETKDEYSAFVNKTVIEKLRLNSPYQRISNNTKPEDKKRLEQGLPIGIWQDWYVEMAQSKAIKKLAKILPIGDSRAATAISADDKAEAGKTVDFKSTAESGVIIEMNADQFSSEPSQAEGPTVESVLQAIGEAASKDDIDAITKAMNALSAEGKRSVQKAFIAKAKEINAIQEPKPQESKPPQAGKQPDWKRQIKESGDLATLDEVVNQMPEAVQIELQDAIDTHQDFLRSQGG